MSRKRANQALLDLIDAHVRSGAAIEIDGLGCFELDGEQVVFQPSNRPRVFLAYAKEDRAQVIKLAAALKKAGFEPWRDEEKLLPGQNWPRAIQRAIELSDFFVMCFSARSVAKRGFFHSELRHALDVAACVPLDEIFLIPVRLSDCEIPLQISRKTQYIDLFPDWHAGMKALLFTLSAQTARRKQIPL